MSEYVSLEDRHPVLTNAKGLFGKDVRVHLVRSHKGQVWSTTISGVWRSTSVKPSTNGLVPDVWVTIETYPPKRRFQRSDEADPIERKILLTLESSIYPGEREA